MRSSYRLSLAGTSRAHLCRNRRQPHHRLLSVLSMNGLFPIIFSLQYWALLLAHCVDSPRSKAHHTVVSHHHRQKNLSLSPSSPYGSLILELMISPISPPLRSRAAGSRRTRRRRMKQRTKETEARFRIRSLPGLLGKNGRQIRTQRGPLTPKPPSFSSEQTRVCGFLECTKIY